MENVIGGRRIQPDAHLHSLATSAECESAHTADPDPIDVLSSLMALGIDALEALDTIAQADPQLAQKALLAWGNGRTIHGSGDYCATLDLHGRDWIRSLPEGMVIDGILDISNCVNLRSLPKTLKVLTLLDLRGCTAWDRFLPPGLRTPGGDVGTDFGFFSGPFDPNGCLVTPQGIYGL